MRKIVIVSRVLALILVAAVTSGAALAAAPVINSAGTFSGAVSKAVTYVITATNIPTSFKATDMPKGLSISTTTGTISGSPLEGGVFRVGIFATNADGTDSKTVVFSITGGSGIPILIPFNNPMAMMGQSISYTLTASGATPFTFTAQGLPPGLSVSGGKVTGTPTQTGTFNVTVAASNSAGNGVPIMYWLVVGPAGGAPLIARPNGIEPTQTMLIGDPIKLTVFAAGTGTLVYTYGTFPKGITAKNSRISGMGQQAGVFQVPLTVSNAVGQDSVMITLNITGTPVAGTIKFKDVYKDTVKTFHEDGESFSDIIGTSAYAITGVLDLSGTNSDFSSDTQFQINIGDVAFGGMLGTAKSFSNGKSAQFVDTVDIGDISPKLVTVRAIKLSYSKDKKLTVTMAGKNDDNIEGAENVVLQDFIDGTDPINTTIPAVIRLGTLAAIFDVKVTGPAPTHKTIKTGSGDNADAFDSISASASGTGTSSK